MALKPLFFTLAVTLTVCAAFKKAHHVPQPYVENLAKIADTEPHNEKKSKLPAKDLKLKSPVKRQPITGRTKHPIQCFLPLQAIHWSLILCYNFIY